MPTQPTTPTTNLERAARRSVERLYRQVGEDVARLRSDAGVSQGALSVACGVDDGFLSRIEHGGERPSLDTLSRLAAGLGADLTVRLYPNTGPALRDRHQAAIAAAILGVRHPRWQAFPEPHVVRPVRGWIDLGLYDARVPIIVALEIESQLARIEQLLRWAQSKATALPSWDGWPRLDPTTTVSSALVVRDTRATRAVVADNRQLLRAAFPAHPDDALAALTGTEPWPGPALLWATRSRDGRGYRLVARR